MFKFLFFSLFWISVLTFPCNAQLPPSQGPYEGTTDSTEKPWLGPVTREANFPGGADSMKAFIKKNLTLPEGIKEKYPDGKSYITMIIEKDGSLTEIQNAKNSVNCKECELAAIQVIKKMPKWIPAEYNDSPVRRRMMIPIRFK